MKLNVLHRLIVIAIILICVAALGWWLRTNPTRHFTELVPGKDNRPETMRNGSASVAIGAHFNAFEGVPSKISGSWPRFRGADFDNINKETMPLASTWNGDGPPELWSVDLGEGHAGPVIADGRVFVLDYNEEKRGDVLRCFSLDDGQEIWQRGYDVYIKRNHGVSRTVPAVQDNRVLTIGPKCHVMCVTADSGKFEWGLDLSHLYDTEVPLWYTGQCALIDDSIAVIAVGGKAMMIGVDLASGEVVWETPNPDNWKMSHSSVIPYTIHGHKMYIYCAIGGLVGVSAEKESSGKLLFASKLFDHNVIAPSAVHLGNGKLFLTAGYGGGSMVVQVKPNGDEFSVDMLQTFKPGEGLTSEQQTPVLYLDHLFGILPKDAGPLRNQFVCVDPADCTKIVWSSGTTERFGLGPYLIADNKFFILSDEGELTIIKVSTKKFELLSRSKVLNGHDAWGPMALVQGRLLARDSRRMVCLDVGAR